MTAEELTAILQTFNVSLGEILSFFVGSLVGFAFVTTANKRWL